jgi:hypothetical protein
LNRDLTRAWRTRRVGSATAALTRRAAPSRAQDRAATGGPAGSGRGTASSLLAYVKEAVAKKKARLPARAAPPRRH